MFRKFLVLAMLAVTAAVTAPSMGQAGFSITLTGNVPPLASLTINDRVGGDAAGPNDDQSGLANRIVLGDGQNTGIPATFDGLSIFFTANSTAPDATLNNPLQTSTNATISNTTGSTVTVTFLVSDNRFITPGNSANILIQTVTVNSFGPPGGSLSSSATATNPDNTSSTTPTITTTVAPNPITTSSTPFVRTGAPTAFTLSNTIVVTLAAGATINFQTSVDLIAAAPAPAGLLLAAFGIPAFGLLRRFGRKTGAAEVAVAA